MTRTLRVSDDLYTRVTDLARDEGVTAGDALRQLMADSGAVRETRGADSGAGDKAQPVVSEPVGRCCVTPDLAVKVSESAIAPALGAHGDFRMEPDPQSSPAPFRKDSAPAAEAQAGRGPSTPNLQALMSRLSEGTPQGKRLARWIETQLGNQL